MLHSAVVYLHHKYMPLSLYDIIIFLAESVHVEGKDCVLLIFISQVPVLQIFQYLLNKWTRKKLMFI